MTIVEKFMVMSKKFLLFLTFLVTLTATLFFVSNVKGAHALTFEIPPECPQVECADLETAYAPGDTNYATGRTAGTLIGLVTNLQGIVFDAQQPLSLAFWGNDYLARVPVLGDKALAATSYPAPFLVIIMVVWKLVRDISFALMAVIMLVIGFMIITRRKISPSAALTAQVAIPRIVIALILITFSYPIGALGASATWVLRGNSAEIASMVDWKSLESEPGMTTNRTVTLFCEQEKNIFQRVWDFITNPDIRRTVLNWFTSFIFDAIPFTFYGKNMTEMSVCGAKFINDQGATAIFARNPDGTLSDQIAQGKLTAAMIAVGPWLLGGGPFILFVVLLTGFAVLIFGILVYIKMIIVYIKLLFSIIVSPLLFAFGAIPGNEGSTIKWFKQFASYVVSIPAMWFAFLLVVQIAWLTIVFSAFEFAGSGFGGGSWVFLLVPFFFIAGANYARKIPDMLDNMIVGPPKGRK